MNKLLNDNLIIDIDKSIKNTYLIIRNIKINQSSYEFKILQEENIDSLLRPEIFYEGSEQLLKYNISDKISLNDYLINNKLKKRDLKFIIKTIDNMLSSIENYLLSENSILLDIRTIMLGKENKKTKLKFVVIPNYNSDFSYELSKLLIRLLRYVDVNDKDALNLAYRLFVKSSKDNYTINDLLEICSEDTNEIEDIIYNNNEDVEYYETTEKENSEEIDYSVVDNYCIKEEKKDNIDEINNDSNLENEGINIDKDIKKIIFDDIFDDDIDEEEKNNKKNKQIDKKKNMITKNKLPTLHFVKFLIPVLILIVPIFVYFKFGEIVFLNNIKYIGLYEIIIMMVFFINIIFDNFQKRIL